MSVCPKCGKSNQPHYKFCLGCGGELSAGPAAHEPVVRPQTSQPEARTVMAESAPAPEHDLEPSDTPRIETAPPIFSDMGPPDTVTEPAIPQINTDVDLPPPAALAPPTANGDAGARLCLTCGTVVASGFRFCPSCGGEISSAASPMIAKGLTGSRPAMTTSPPTHGRTPARERQMSGRLTLVRPDGSEGGTHPIVEGENQIGRTVGGLFEADGYLSPIHAELVLNAAGLVVRDLSSLNGVFVKLTSEEELQDGDVFRIGQELLRFDAIPAPSPIEDGTDILGSPNSGFWGRLAIVVGRDQDGSAYPLLGDAVLLGRERGDILFPEDGYVSGSHARVAFHDGGAWLSDLNSSNGTFVRVREERLVQSGAYLLLGQQLFRVQFE